MSDQPKVSMNFNAPVTGAAGNVEGDMIVNSTNSEATKAGQQISALIAKLRAQHPAATDAEIFDILLRGFTTMPQKQPENWQRWQDILSVVFAGGIEATKVLVPVAGIPIEVLKRLYEIYQRNRQLPA